MKSEILLSILLLGGSAGVCVAQTAEPAPATAEAAPASAPPPAEATPSAAAPAPPAEATPAPAPEAATPAAAPDPAAQPAAAPVADPSAPLVAYSGSMATMMGILTPEKAAFGLLGAAAMIAEGKDIIRANDIVDPSQEIARDVATDFARTKQARAATVPLAFERKGLPKPAVLAGAASDAAYVVDVDSSWSMTYYPVDWLKFRVYFFSNLRLVDAKSKQVVVKHLCKWDGDKQGDPKFTRDELLGEFAKGLKAAMGRGADYCKAEFRAKIAEKTGGGGKPAEPAKDEPAKDEPAEAPEKVAASA